MVYQMNIEFFSLACVIIVGFIEIIIIWKYAMNDEACITLEIKTDSMKNTKTKVVTFFIKMNMEITVVKFVRYKLL